MIKVAVKLPTVILCGFMSHPLSNIHGFMFTLYIFRILLNLKYTQRHAVFLYSRTRTYSTAVYTYMSHIIFNCIAA